MRHQHLPLRLIFKRLLTVEWVSPSSVSLKHRILDIQVLGLDPCLPSDRLTTLQAVNFRVLNFESDQVGSIGETAFTRRVGIPPCLTMSCML